MTTQHRLSNYVLNDKKFQKIEDYNCNYVFG